MFKPVWYLSILLGLSFAAHSFAQTKTDSYRIFNINGQLKCSYNYQGKGIFEFGIGGGGAISSLTWTATTQSLLSPTYAGEHTDRVIQTTWWLNSLRLSQTGSTEQRWNVTQAGNGKGIFSPIDTVIVDARHHIIDVYSYPHNQWDQTFDSHLIGGYKMLTRYQGLVNGVISIRRIMIATQPDSDHVAKPYTNLYVEGWTPFNRSGSTFNALALSFDKTAAPNWWYLAGYNIPNYSQIRVEKTKGYSVVYDRDQVSTGVFAALVFGKSQPVNNSATYVLNTMCWDNGIGVLPGFTVANFPVKGVIDQTFYLYINKGINANTVAFLDNLALRIPLLKIYTPADALPDELDKITGNINKYTNAEGNRTELLGNIATSLAQ